MGQDNINAIEEFIDSLVCENNFEEAVALLKTISDKEEQRRVCFLTLSTYGAGLAAAEYGEVRIIQDKGEYEKIKRGMGDFAPNAVLYVDGDENVHGLEEMLDFIPEDNPMKQFYMKIA